MLKNDTDTLLTLKNSEELEPEEGIAYIVWYVHPNVASGNFLKGGRPVENMCLPRPCDRNALPSSKSNLQTCTPTELEPSMNVSELDGEGPRYLVSMSDLAREHLPYLEAMKKDVQEIMLDVHNITEADGLHMYFHWPYEEETAALHLHVRAGHHNPPDMEQTKSFELETVIQELKKHGSMTQFLEDNMPIRESEPGILDYE